MGEFPVPIILSEAEFLAEAVADGYSAPGPLRFEPDGDADLHTHDFAVFLRVVEGELTLRYPEGSATFTPGNVCRMAAGTSHTEVTGPEGADVIIATRGP